MEPADVDLLMAWENASEDWWVGATLSPISRAAMTTFVNGGQDLFEARQIRWMVDARHEDSWRTVGAVDLYDFDPRQLRAGVAIHVDDAHRRQGHAHGALQLMLNYAGHHLHLRQVYAEIPGGHRGSLDLFCKAGFGHESIRSSWIRTPEGVWTDVHTLQHLFTAENP
jgi:diamine N-acetyltransferase